MFTVPAPYFKLVVPFQFTCRYGVGVVLVVTVRIYLDTPTIHVSHPAGS